MVHMFWCVMGVFGSCAAWLRQSLAGVLLIAEQRLVA